MNDQIDEQTDIQEIEQANAPANDQPSAPMNDRSSVLVNSHADEPMYDQTPPPEYTQAPPPEYTQAPAPMYNQAPPPMYSQAPPIYTQAPPMYNQAPPMYSQVPPPMYNQAPPPMYPAAKPAKKSSRAVLGATLAAALMAVVSVVSWFLPLGGFLTEYVHGDGSNILSYYSMLAPIPRIVLYAYAVIGVLNIVWSAIPKKWAAVAGVISSFLCLAAAVYMVNDCIAPIFSNAFYSNISDYALDFGAYLILPCALFTVIWNVVKLICTAAAKKRNRTDNGKYNNYGAGQPPYMTV